MNDKVMDTATLSASLHEFIKTPTVSIHRVGDRIILSPHTPNSHAQVNRPILGRFKSDTSTVDELQALRAECEREV
jgi:virulence-associated protein VagC